MPIYRSTLQFMFIICNVGQESNKDLWLLDSGWSDNMTEDRNLFTRLGNFVKARVKLEDHNVINDVSKGIISVLGKNM